MAATNQCPMFEYKGRPSPGAAYALALWEDGIRTVDDYRRMIGAVPFRVTPDEGAEMGRIATAKLFGKPTSQEATDGR